MAPPKAAARAFSLNPTLMTSRFQPCWNFVATIASTFWT